MLAHIDDRHRDQDRDLAPLRLQGRRSSSAVAPAHALDEHGCLIDQQ
jgi:hypothetical protein